MDVLKRSSNLLIRLLLILPLGAAAGAQSAQGAWQLRQEDTATQTRVWTLPRPGAVPAFRASTIVDARLSALAAVLLDEKRTQDWVYRARQTQLLKTDGPARGVSLVITAMPFPLSDRDAVVAWEISQDPQTLAVSLRGHGVPDDKPAPREGRVRMRNVESSWTLTPRQDGRVDVLFEGQGDPGGNLDAPLLRGFVAEAIWEAPWETIQGLRRIVQEPGYAGASLPFIREPSSASTHAPGRS